MILSAMFPFYGMMAGNLKDFPWMIGVNIGILAVVILAVLLLAKPAKKLQGFGDLLGRACVTSLLADAAGLFVRFLPLLAEMLLRLVGAKSAA